MASDRDIQDDSDKRKDTAAPEVERTAASVGAAEPDFFGNSYSKMHQEIFAELYKPIGYDKKTADLFGQTELKDPFKQLQNNKNSNDFFKPLPVSFNPKEPTTLPDLSLVKNQKTEPDAPAEKQPTNEPGSKAETEPAAEQSTLPESRQEEKPLNGKVSRNGNQLHIEYAGNQKTRDITFDSNGQAQEIVTKDQSGTLHLVRRGEQWHARIQGMELPMPGKVEANDRGEVTFEMEQGIFRREKPDGTSVLEKTNADGSRISFYSNNEVENLTRKDGSTVHVSADGKNIIETLPNSNRSVRWTKQDDGSFRSDGQPPQERKNFQIDASGKTSWDGPDGLKFVVNGDGSMLVQGDGQAKIQLDEENRIKSIDYGKKVREFEYFDNSREIKKTTITDSQSKASTSFTRDKADSNQWKTQSGQSWTGEIKVGTGGVYSYKPSGSSITAADKDGRAYTMWPDGRVTRDVIGNDGSRLSYEKDKLVKALAQDGTSAEISDNKIVVDNPRSGQKITWTKEGEGWKSDSPKFPGTKKDLQINDRCEVSFMAEDGNRHSIRPDGKEVINRKDGVQLELNEDGQIDRIQKGDSVRSIERDQDGKIIRVSDQNKDSKRSVIEQAADAGVSKVDINADGDILVERSDKSSTLERSDFTSVTRDSDGSPLTMRNQRGDRREFKWQQDGQSKTLVEIKDTKQSSKGEVSETWTRKPGTNDFVSIGKNNKEKIRENVQLNPDGNGEYSYKNKDGGKDRIAKLGGSDSALSESVEEARESLLDEIRDKLPEQNFKRMQEMMQNFEKRMGDRAYLRKLAGVKGADAIDDEVQKEVQATYDNLRSMISKGDEGTFYNQQMRVKLAENFMFNAMEPTVIDQGPASQSDWNGHGTCWISTGEIWGMTQHPGAMADYLKQVCLDGKITTKNSGEKDATPQTYTFSSRLLQFDGKKQESKWTIETATTEWRDEGNMKTQIWGDRSPVSKIFQYTLPVLSGSRKEFDVDGGLYETANIVGQGHTRGVRDIMYMVTGDYPVDRAFKDHSDGHLMNNNYIQSMLEKGTVLSYTPGHLRSQTVRQVDGKWYLYQDDQHSETSDSVMAQISDIEKWAKGDKSQERPVNVSAMDLLHKRTWTGSGAADAVGTVIPRKSSSQTPVNNAAQPKPSWTYSRQSQSYLPQIEISYKR